MKKFSIAADILYQAYFEVDASNESEAKRMVEDGEVDFYEQVQVASPILVNIEEMK